MRAPAFLALAAAALAACTPPPAPIKSYGTLGTPATAAPSDEPEPTLRLPRHFVPTDVRARLALDPARPTFAGEVAITGHLEHATHTIWLHAKDLQITVATATRTDAGTATPVTTPLAATAKADDLLELRAPADAPLAAGTYTITVAYAGKVVTDTIKGAFHAAFGKDDYLLSDFEPTDARRVFPSLDEPDRKVPWQLTVDAPTGLVAVSNTPETRATALDATHTRHEFAPTRPLPSYLVAFAVGPFDVVDAGTSKSGIPCRILAPRGTAERVEYGRTVLPRLVDALEAWFGMRYPYPKLDVVVSPSFENNAMENAGAIFTDPVYAFVDRARPSWEQRHQFVMTIGHELAHQWFGDLVTCGWWDDIWLNESFATWFENKIPLLLDASWHDEGLPAGVRVGAVLADQLVTARRIREPIRARADIPAAFDGITYNKGASLLRMIERYVGEAEFRRGVQVYLSSHVDGTATASDFIRAIETSSGKSLSPIMSPFLDQAGLPVVEPTVACAPGAPAQVTFAQRRAVPAGSPAPATQAHWRIPVCVAYADATNHRAEACGVIDRPTDALALPAASGCPAWLVANAGGTGYFETAYTDAQALAIRDKAWPLMDPSERRVAFEDIRTQTLAGAIPVATLMSLQAKLLAGSDRFELADALGGIGRDGELADMTGLPRGLDWLVGKDQRAAVDAWVRAKLAPRVRALAFAHATKDPASFDDEVIARAFTEAAAHVREPSLVPRALALAPKSKDLPASVRGTVLAIAADASPAVFAQLKAAVAAEPNRDRRQELLGALARVHDPARHTAALDLVLDPHFDIDDAPALLFAFDDEQARARVAAWVRAHWPELAKRLPPAADGNWAPWLARAFTEACDPAARDEIAAYVQQTFGTIFGGQRIVAHAVEGMDQCIRQRAIVAPSLAAWLAAAKK